MEEKKLSRRDFFKVAGAAAGSYFMPDWLKNRPSAEIHWLSLTERETPEALRPILNLTPRTSIDSNGYLVLEDGGAIGRVPLAQTEWSRHRSRAADILRDNQPRGIVLHWFGNDPTAEDWTIQNFLWGYDGVRTVTPTSGGSYDAVTSSHFLIGENPPTTGLARLQDAPSILQTQAPYEGQATISSHLELPLDRVAYREGRHHFISSFDALGWEYGFPHGVFSGIQEYFRNSWVDPNWYTYSLELSGRRFDDSASHPPDQEVANTLSVVWALMKKDNIPSTNVWGHYEFQLNRADPGKKFMAQFRLLLGLKALTENDPQMNQLVFGPFLQEGMNTQEATRQYFDFVRDYLVLVNWGFPQKVFEWESETKYWTIYDRLFREGPPLPIADSFRMPIDGEIRYGNTFLQPENHEGTDFNTGEPYEVMGDLGTPILAIANGECIFAEEIPGHGLGKVVMLKHRLPEGAEVISLYGHLNDIEIQTGNICQKGQEIATMGASGGQSDSHLHLAIAYGATWDTDLSHRAYVPSSVSATWIRRRYLDPITFINSRLEEETVSEESSRLSTVASDEDLGLQR
jgi:murein DD-endopeptidase MepM/ murein hydrolase activator NlpD